MAACSRSRCRRYGPQAEVRSPSSEVPSMTESGPRAQLITFRKAAVLDRRDTSKRERRSIVAQCHAVQGAEGIIRFEPRAAAVISDSIGMPPHLLLPVFDCRCQTISRPTTSDEQRMESRFSHEAGNSPNIRRFQS